VFSAEDKAGAPVLLKLEPLHQMAHVSAAIPVYACGSRVLPDGDFFHFGGFDGTPSFPMHGRDGLAWPVVNTRRAHSAMEKDLHKLSWDMARMLQA
jgi:hypothetical protein